eukprot:1089815-Pleurochrysis_carterae.AAC.1
MVPTTLPFREFDVLALLLSFISTERFKFCIIAYDTTTKEIVTRANGDISDRTGAPPLFSIALAQEQQNCLRGGRLLHLKDK